MLKAFMGAHFPDLQINAFHLYLKIAEQIGYKVYHAISKTTWLAESVYGALLFPEREKEIGKVFLNEAKGKADLREVDFHDLTSLVKEATESLINSVEWTDCSLACFSICLCQLTSSLYVIRRVKKAFPNLSIVVGGSMFSGDHAVGLLKTFPEVNFVINGEGELPLSRLVGTMKDSKGTEDLPPIPGVVMRAGANTGAPVAFDQLANLNSLPPPDYDEYFALLKTLDPGKAFFPTLPAEISRGCWWRSTRGSSEDKGCAFCNLNLQWEGYRSKGVSQIVSEVDHLTTKYQSLSVAFMDNLLPLRSSGEIFQGLDNLGKDLRIFGEIRATTPGEVLEAMKAAGIEEVQVGIEALSTKLLQRLNKGTTAIQNLEIMKNCEALGISCISNLILHFPGSDAEDVEETRRALEFALPFRPLKCVGFWLGLGSPVWQNRQAFGLVAVSNHPKYAALFPPHIHRSMDLMIQSYKGDLGYQRKLWQPVRMKVRAWESAFQALHDGLSKSPILSFRDGRDFMIIRQRRLNAEPVTHRLVGTSREIYLFCEKHRSLKRIEERFPKVGEEKILPFLKMMVDKRLMFEEKGRYLSLAVRVNIILLFGERPKSKIHSPKEGT
jgi:ribosomal peptide maturation radical SAM protein 1